MKRLTYALAILVAASTATLAGEIKQDRKATSNVPTVSATQMTDADMDKITAGDAAYVSVQTLSWLNPGQVYVTVFNGGQAELFRYVGLSTICVNSSSCLH
jgi:hypothetical protein